MFDRYRSAREGNGPRTRNLDDAVVGEELREGIDFLGVARQLHDDVFGPDIDNARTEDVDHIDDLRTRLLGRVYLDEHELPCDGLILGKIDDLHHVDEFGELCHNLPQFVLRGDRDNDVDACDRGFLCIAGRDALDVEGTAADESCDMGQDARFVVDKDGKQIFVHLIFLPTPFGRDAFRPAPSARRLPPRVR